MCCTGWGSTGVWKLFSGSCDPKKLSKETADKLCANPCYWYGKKGSGQAKKSFIDANMCDCSKGDEPFGGPGKAINWDVEPTTMPTFVQSKTHSITSTKEYQEKIKIEESNETKLTQSSEFTSTTVTFILGHFNAITAIVGPPTYPAPIQQIFIASTLSTI